MLFCHVIQSGNTEDLDRMKAFVVSLEPGCQRSRAVAMHHDLFQVFHSVAARYIELKSTSEQSQENQEALRLEMDTYLEELGMQPQMRAFSEHSQLNSCDKEGVGADAGFDMGLATGSFGLDEGSDQVLQMTNWYSMSQQMMGLLDSDHMPI